MSPMVCVYYVISFSSGNYGEDDIEVDTCSDLDHDQSDQIGQRMINHDGDTLLVQGLIPFSTSEDELADFFNVSHHFSFEIN